MGPWTYYAPLWLGTLVSAGAYFAIFPDAADGAIWPQIVTVPLRSLGIGVSLQLIMISFQGLFARVLPAPAGRSIRGGTAQVVGVFVLGHEAVGLLGLGAYFLSELPSLASALFVISGILLAIASIIYLINIPGSPKDF